MIKNTDELINVIVRHKSYGIGVVTYITNENIYVDFDGRIRIFPYPDSFEKEYLIIAEPDIEISYAEQETENRPDKTRKMSVSAGMERLLDEYCSAFPLRWDNQRYLWKCVRTFQDRWDPDAADLSGMIRRATADADHLMNATRYYPREQIVGLAAKDSREVRSMFKDLFDEGRDLVERSNMFSDRVDRLLEGMRGKAYSQNHHRTMNAVSTYLWLKYPDRYYFFKDSVGREVSKATGFEFDKRGVTTADTMTSHFTLFDRVSEVIRQDGRFRKLLDERLDGTLYADDQLHCMTIDFAFFIRPLYANRKT